MKNTKLHSRTVRLDPVVDEAVEQLAAADRRPVGQYLRNIIADAIAVRSTGRSVASPHHSTGAEAA
jgi:predicted transcriptional regulator